MKLSVHAAREERFGAVQTLGPPAGQSWSKATAAERRIGLKQGFWAMVDRWCDMVAPCPWSAHVGLSAFAAPAGWGDQAVPRVVPTP